jgi:hypothetical protein
VSPPLARGIDPRPRSTWDGVLAAAASSAALQGARPPIHSGVAYATRGSLTQPDHACGQAIRRVRTCIDRRGSKGSVLTASPQRQTPKGKQNDRRRLGDATADLVGVLLVGSYCLKPADRVTIIRLGVKVLEGSY